VGGGWGGGGEGGRGGGEGAGGGFWVKLGFNKMSVISS